MSAKKVFIKTFGCQMNVYDSERILESLSSLGFEETSQISCADLVVLNTCNIREKAAEKVYSELGRIRRMCEDSAHRDQKKTVVVAGCVAQAESYEIINRASVVDIIVGPQSYHMLPEMIKDTERHGHKLIDVNFNHQQKFNTLPQRNTKNNRATAFLTVQEGCDKCCTFCVVPYTRGAEYSRPVEQILNEAIALISRGAFEITLLGQNVNAYRGKGPDGRMWSLSKLINTLSELDGIKRLRYTTSHPCDIDEELIECHNYNSKLMPHLHLPFQAGSNRILAAMNRKHTSEEYLRIVDSIRLTKADIALSTDIIVGFPGETVAEFDKTLRVVEEVGFAQAFSFKYSPRPGTPAAAIKNHISEAEKASRLNALQSLIKEQQLRFNISCINKTLPVLFDRHGRNSGQLLGRSPYLQPVHAIIPYKMLGQIVPVKIISAKTNSLFGILQGSQL
ncbi:MAG TPA: tRNA-2-methylthio-N(6)-dimethylallyladenosine synthase [Hyphomicrobiaceae bacterium MAG_BT-2024]